VGVGLVSDEDGWTDGHDEDSLFTNAKSPTTETNGGRTRNYTSTHIKRNVFNVLE